MALELAEDYDSHTRLGYAGANGEDLVIMETCDRRGWEEAPRVSETQPNAANTAKINPVRYTEHVLPTDRHQPPSNSADRPRPCRLDCITRQSADIEPLQPTRCAALRLALGSRVGEHSSRWAGGADANYAWAFDSVVANHRGALPDAALCQLGLVASEFVPDLLKRGFDDGCPWST